MKYLVKYMSVVEPVMGEARPAVFGRVVSARQKICWVSKRDLIILLLMLALGRLYSVMDRIKTLCIYEACSGDYRLIYMIHKNARLASPYIERYVHATSSTPCPVASFELQD